MDNLIEIIILAVIQGITEFLPISSSGHLAVFGKALGIEEDNLLISVVLHAGTLLAILVYYAKAITKEIKDKNYKLFSLIALGTLPLVLIALIKFPINGKSLSIKDAIEHASGNMLVVAGSFCITFIMLVFVLREKGNNRSVKEMSIWAGIWIGLAQALALLPGVSRSGSTIAAATRCGLNAENAAKYSFFLGIPALSGAMLLNMKDLMDKFGSESQGVGILPLSIGFLVSAVVGYFSLAILIKLLKKGRLAIFGYYCLALAIIIAVPIVF